MMMITPQARRRITGAVRALPEPRRNRWEVWAGQTAPTEIRTNVPNDIAIIALEALTTAERDIRERLAKVGLDEDSEADLLNDLGYIQAIETAFRNEGIGR
jgi:hypothetical protein